MENASKALIIAGAILLSIAIIGIGMYVYNIAADSFSDIDMTDEQARAYNQEFTVYQGNIRGSRAKTLCDTISIHNRTATDDSQKIAVFYGQAVQAEYAAGNTSGTDTTSINTIKNQNLQSGKTYTVDFGFDKSSGLVTAVFINEAGNN